MKLTKRGIVGDHCAEELPADGEAHWVSCPECQEELPGGNYKLPDGCPEHQRIMSEYDRVMEPIFQAWERGETVRLPEVQ